MAIAVAADADRVDRIAREFAWVIDAKSAFTYAHSERVGAVTALLATRLGTPLAPPIRATAYSAAA